MQAWSRCRTRATPSRPKNSPSQCRAKKGEPNHGKQNKMSAVFIADEMLLWPPDLGTAAIRIQKIAAMVLLFHAKDL
jgi:hypothetical protein